MRVTTAFNRMLRLPRAWVRDVAFGSEGVIVTVALRPRATGLLGVRHARAADQGPPRQELAASRSRREPLPDRVPAQTAVLPWAAATCTSRCRGLAPAPRIRAISRTSVAFLAQQMAKTPITKLMRIGWRSVGKILARVVADKLDRGRLDGLVMIGVRRGVLRV